MTEQVWAVTAGSYSDYRVVAVFESKQDAEAFIETAKAIGGEYEYARPEAMEPLAFFPAGQAPERRVSYRHWIVVWDDGTTTDEREMQDEAWEFDSMHYTGDRPRVRFNRAPIYKGIGGQLEVEGGDKAAVDKAFSDNLAQRLAEQPRYWAKPR